MQKALEAVDPGCRVAFRNSTALPAEKKLPKKVLDDAEKKRVEEEKKKLEEEEANTPVIADFQSLGFESEKKFSEF